MTTTQPESFVLRQVRDYLKWNGWFVVRIQQGMGAHKGVPDLLCIREGRVVFAEVKTPTGRLSAHQVQFASDWTSHKGECVVLRSVEDAQKLSGDPALF